MHVCVFVRVFVSGLTKMLNFSFIQHDIVLWENWYWIVCDWCQSLGLTSGVKKIQ